MGGKQNAKLTNGRILERRTAKYLKGFLTEELLNIGEEEGRTSDWSMAEYWTRGQQN
jgi:hypothetical protein